MEYRWTLTHNSTSTVLAQDPLGWDRAILSFERDPNWHGVFSEYTVDSLEFICDGKDIIQQAYETEGVNAEIALRIDWRCDRTNIWHLLLIGSLDMATLAFQQGGNTAKVAVITESVARTLRSRYEMPVDLNSEISKDGNAITPYDNGKWPIRVNSEAGQPIRKVLAGKFPGSCLSETVGGDAYIDVVGAGLLPPLWDSGSTYVECEPVVAIVGGLCQALRDVPAGIEPGITSGWESYWSIPCQQKAWAAAAIQAAGDFDDFGCCTALMTGRLIPGGGIDECAQENNGVWIVPGFEALNNEFGGTTNPATIGGYYNDREDLGTCGGGGGTTTATEPDPIFVAPKDAAYVVNFSCELIFDIATLATTVASTCEDECTGGDFENDWCSLDFSAYIEVSGIPTLLYSASNISPHGGNDSVDNYGRFTHVVAFAIINQTFNMLAGETFKIYVNIQLSNSYTRDSFSDVLVMHAVWLKFTTTGNCCFAAYYDDYEELPAGSTIPVYLPHEAANRVVASITDSAATVESGLFGRPDAQPEPAAGPYTAYGCASLQGLTNGLLIRGFDFENNPEPSPAVCGLVVPGEGGTTSIAVKGMFLSLKQLFEGMDAINAIGMGVIEDPTGVAAPVVVLETKEYFYQNTVVLEIDISDRQLVNFERVVDNSVIYNEMATGFAKFEGEAFTGLYEFATMRTYKTVIQKVRRRLDKICDFIASGYTFELTRRQNLAKNGSSDWRYDNDIFVVSMADTGDEDGQDANIELTVGGTPKNLLNPAATMNWRIAPWKMVRNWLSWIGRSGWPALNMAVEFTSGKANWVPEGADPANALLPDTCDLGQRVDNATQTANNGRVPVYARPEKITLQLSLTVAQILQIRANPFGLVRLNEPTQITDCWISKIEYPLEDNLAKMELIPKIQ